MTGPEQGREQNQGISQQIAGAFDRLRGRDTFTPEDQVWGQYMDKRRDWRDLVALVGDEQIQPEFQRRAIEVLLAPDINQLPFPVNVDAASNNYSGVSSQWTENLTDEQAGFVAGLIPDYMQQAGVLIRRDGRNYGARDALFTYNYLIPRLLSKLPPEQAERLFESFSINDHLAYWNLDAASGYDPLQSLYRNRNVDESWKRKAASQMHEIIEREQRGETQPRAEYEGAVRQYGQALGMMLYGEEGLPVSREFYQEEIAFMLGIETGKAIVEVWHTGQVLRLLDDAEVRHNFARRQILTGEPDSFWRFRVTGDADAETARRIIAEFPEDNELKTYLEQELQEWVFRSEREAQRREQAERTEQEVLRRMRKSSSE